MACLKSSSYFSDLSSVFGQIVQMIENKIKETSRREASRKKTPADRKMQVDDPLINQATSFRVKTC